MILSGLSVTKGQGKGISSGYYEHIGSYFHRKQREIQLYNQKQTDLHLSVMGCEKGYGRESK